MRAHKTVILLTLGFLIGISVLLYPAFSNYWNSFTQSRAIASYSEKVAEIDEFLAKNSQTASDLTAEQKTAYDEAVNKIANVELSGSIEIVYKENVPYANVTINNISELEGKTYKIIIVYIGENDVQLGRKIVDGTSTKDLLKSYDNGIQRSNRSRHTEMQRLRSMCRELSDQEHRARKDGQQQRL